MLAAILAGLLVSIDALFIGVSFGTQKKCKFWHILVINIALFGLCILGYYLGILIGDRVDIELDLVIGIVFISLGVWVIASYFLFERRKRKKQENSKIEDSIDCLSESSQETPANNQETKTDTNNNSKKEGSTKNIWLTGLFMSVEAMFITIGLTLTLDVTTILIPLTVAIAHFAYCTATFFLSKYLRKFPAMVGHIIAGSALIVYGIMAIVI